MIEVILKRFIGIFLVLLFVSAYGYSQNQSGAGSIAKRISDLHSFKKPLPPNLKIEGAKYYGLAIEDSGKVVIKFFGEKDLLWGEFSLEQGTGGTTYARLNNDGVIS